MFFELNPSLSSVKTCVPYIMHVNTMLYYSVEYIVSHGILYDIYQVETVAILPNEYYII